DHETVIVINSGVRGGQPVRELVTNGSIIYATFDTTLPEAFQPKSKQDSYLVYGVADEGSITFPFNRADYYLARPSDISANCAHKDTTHGAGTLYRRPVNKDRTPILDCVADFQVEFLNESGTVTDIDFRDPSGNVRDDAAQQIRQTVKEVRVFILAQQGKKDPGYSYPVSTPDRALVVGDRVWTQSDLESKLGGDWRHYRWKVFTIAVQPKNLN
ncbi:MAG TPA: pilus assembly protein PilW, partial [Geomonas sp.]